MAEIGFAVAFQHFARQHIHILTPRTEDIDTVTAVQNGSVRPGFETMLLSWRQRPPQNLRGNLLEYRQLRLLDDDSG